METAAARPSWASADRVALVVAVALTIAAFAPTLGELVTYWSDTPEYGHGFLMPIVAAYFVWRRRRELGALEPRPSPVGAALLLPSLALLLLGEMKLSWFLKPYAFVFTLGALAWAFYGRRAVRLALPALVVLLLMCPLPGRVQNAITFPLKHTAALFATGLLDATGYTAAMDGNVIHLERIRDLWIADACSGIRSLISLVSLAIITCLVWPRHWSLRTAVVASAVPVAVLVNGLRIWGTGVLAVEAGPETATGFFHLFEGLLLFAVAGLILWGWASLLGRAFRRGPA